MADVKPEPVPAPPAGSSTVERFSTAYSWYTLAVLVRPT